MWDQGFIRFAIVGYNILHFFYGQSKVKSAQSLRGDTFPTKFGAEIGHCNVFFSSVWKLEENYILSLKDKTGIT